MIRLLLLSIIFLSGHVSHAHAERLITLVSTKKIHIGSNFLGDDLAIFGAIEADGQTASRRGSYDIIIRLYGTKQNYIVRQKGEVAGIWVNRKSRDILEAPSYMAILSSHPVDDIAEDRLIEKQALKLDWIPLKHSVAGDVGYMERGDPVRAAFIHLKQKEGLYFEQPEGVTFLTPSLFHSAIKLPANVPTGMFTIEILLIADGALLASDIHRLRIEKVDFEAYVSSAAQTHRLAYGMAAAALALITGLGAAIAFRR